MPIGFGVNCLLLITAEPCAVFTVPGTGVGTVTYPLVSLSSHLQIKEQGPRMASGGVGFNLGLMTQILHCSLVEPSKIRSLAI